MNFHLSNMPWNVGSQWWWGVHWITIGWHSSVLMVGSIEVLDSDGGKLPPINIPPPLHSPSPSCSHYWLLGNWQHCSLKVYFLLAQLSTIHSCTLKITLLGTFLYNQHFDIKSMHVNEFFPPKPPLFHNLWWWEYVRTINAVKAHIVQLSKGRHQNKKHVSIQNLKSSPRNMMY